MRCSLCSGETETSYYKGMINSTCGKQGQLPESEGRKRMKRNLPSELGWEQGENGEAGHREQQDVVVAKRMVCKMT